MSMRLRVFDRSGLYSPSLFDIHRDPELFVQVIAGYTMMNDTELGPDIFVECQP
jgi:Fungal protein kinase